MARKTVFIDIDGTIFKHYGNLNMMVLQEPELIRGTVEKFLEWRKKEYYIVLTTARLEGMRQITQKQLTDAGLFYDQMIMGLPPGARILINDEKPDGTKTATSFCIKRDSGIRDINI
jgi:FMN phosphatase YigB (HAD superfamily)